jgi:hypothetical protein
MKKKALIILTGLAILWTGPVFGQSDMITIKGKNMEKSYFIQTIETGDQDWKSLIDAIKNEKITFDEISPSAIANYLEAIANEGLMEFIPSDYFYNEDLQVSLDVVFETPSNICNNSSVYRDQLE